MYFKRYKTFTLKLRARYNLNEFYLIFRILIYGRLVMKKAEKNCERKISKIIILGAFKSNCFTTQSDSLDEYHKNHS